MQLLAMIETLKLILNVIQIIVIQAVKNLNSSNQPVKYGHCIGALLQYKQLELLFSRSSQQHKQKQLFLSYLTTALILFF